MTYESQDWHEDLRYEKCTEQFLDTPSNGGIMAIASGDLRVGDIVYLKARVVDIVEPRHRGIGVGVIVNEKETVELPLWVDLAALTVRGAVAIEDAKTEVVDGKL